MQVFLRDITIKGIKNIDKAIKLVFCKKDIRNIDELKAYNIKAIYGPNGSGKTAIVHAFQLMKDIILDGEYLYKEETAKYLFELLNKKTKAIEIKCSYYSIVTNDLFVINTYEIHLAQIGTGFEIIYEKFSEKQKEYSKENIHFESKDGKVITSVFPDFITEGFTNLISKRSFFDIISDYSFRYLDIEGEKNDDLYGISLNAFNIGLPLLEFVFSLNTMVDIKDDHLPAIKRTLPDFEEIIQRRKVPEITRISLKIGYSNLEMTESELNSFKYKMKKKEKFIRLFKPEIKSIDVIERLISVSSYEKTYLVNQFINYGDYSIDLEFESVGIKKLMNLYNVIEAVTNGEIAVIDELDSHINDVYLIQLIEYVSNYAQGQLIFTTHNISPMDVLRSKKMSIDFMSSSSVITTWTQVGNYSPKKLYQNGMIKGLPFNVECEDFIEVFSHEE